MKALKKNFKVGDNVMLKKAYYGKVFKIIFINNSKTVEIKYISGTCIITARKSEIIKVS